MDTKEMVEIKKDKSVKNSRIALLVIFSAIFVLAIARIYYISTGEAPASREELLKAAESSPCARSYIIHYVDKELITKGDIRALAHVCKTEDNHQAQKDIIHGLSRINDGQTPLNEENPHDF